MPNDTGLPMMKFGIGQPVPRTEDPRLLTGRGRYSDDVDLPGQAYAAIARSAHAHGEIRGIDAAAALALPGVLAVYTGDDLAAAGIGTLPCAIPLKNRDGSDMARPPRPALARGRVRHRGDPIAAVIAETRAAARDGADALGIEIAPLPAVTDARAALAADAPQVWPEVPGNRCLDFLGGDAAAVEAGFAAAAHVSRLEMRNNRVHVSPIEPRAAVAAYDPAGERFTLHLGCQGVFGLRNTLAKAIFKVEPRQFRLLAGDVGGSFGMKSAPYPEYVAILFAARALGRPVKWCDERADSFVSDHHGRDSHVVAELALDGEGRFLAARVRCEANVGAYLSPVGPMMQTNNIIKNMPSVYALPAIAVETRAAFTNTTPVAAYRGAGRPEGNYYIERLIDQAARETGIDRIELRRRNLVAPDALPFTAASGQVYDSGDFPALLDRALAAADVAGFARRKAASAATGRLRGLGIAPYLEVTAPPNPEMGGLRFGDDGRVTIVSGTLDYGQGHAATFAQVLHQALGVPFDAIDLLQGDSDELIAGGGTGGSRSTIATGNAVRAAADQVIDKGRQIAGHVLEAAIEDVTFADGRFAIAGTDRGIGIMDLAGWLRDNADGLPPDLPASLDSELVREGDPSSFPNGCHICEVEIDPETGVVTVDRYTVVDDFGTIVNPMLVEGQVHGGIVQGLGQALREEVRYDDAGQLIAGSYMDYALPRAADVPGFAFESRPVPATTNPLGAKGCGEAGVSGALPASMNAIVDALSDLGVRHIDMPATPERIWRAIRDARA